MSAPKVFFYVQHLLGIGHSMRAAQLTRAMSAAGLTVTLVNGGVPTTLDDPGPVTYFQLPPARAADASFSGIVDEDGRPIDDAWKNRRAAELLALFETARPDLLIVETFPFGRWPFRFEILPLLEAAQAQCPVLCSIRDILVPKSTASRNAKIRSLVEAMYDGVLVHGDPELTALGDSFVHAGDIAAMTHYTGYVAPDPEPASPVAEGEIVVSAGGGGTGELLMAAACAAAAAKGGAGFRWRFLIGPNCNSATAEALYATPGITVEPVRPDFRALLAGAALSISQAGYNTVMDLLGARVRNILVPFSRHGQTEQKARAELLARRGLSLILDEETLTPEGLLAAIETARTMERPGTGLFDFDGARKTAALAKQYAEGGLGARPVQVSGAAR